MGFNEFTEFSLRHVTNVHLRRSIPAGACAYLVGYFATYVTEVFQPETLLQRVIIHIPYGGGYVPLLELVNPKPPTWKAVGWFFHAAHHSKLVIPGLLSRDTLNIALVTRLGGPYQALYLIPPLVLVGTGYIVACYGETYGFRGEDYAGASIVFGYLPCAVAGGLLYTVGHPVVGPELLSTFFIAGGVYPILFGWLGGRTARMWGQITQRVQPSDPDT